MKPKELVDMIVEDDRTIVVSFKDKATRDHFRQLCKDLGHDEHALAQRLLTQFISYCEETRPKKKGE